MDRVAMDRHDCKLAPPAQRRGSRPLLWLLTFLILHVAGGATCYRQTVNVNHLPPPAVFDAVPTLEQLTEVVNRTDAVGQLSSNTVAMEVLSMGNIPRLSATLAIDRPRNFRMRASLPILLGSGLDLGSNEQSFWFQIPEGMSQTLYYSSHEQFQRQPVRSILPVDPTWIGDALGLVHINPSDVVEGPIQRTDGRLEVRTMIPMVDGLYSRVCIIEPTAGYVTDQMLYGPDGRMVAAASGSLHRYYPDQQCALPHRVQLKLLPSDGPPLELRLEIGNYVVNQLISADPQLFAMPQDAARQVDLALLSGSSLVPPPEYNERYPGVPNGSGYSGSHDFPGQQSNAGNPPDPDRPVRSVYLPPSPPQTAMMQNYR